jgi:hypothetical protein
MMKTYLTQADRKPRPATAAKRRDDAGILLFMLQAFIF